MILKGKASKDFIKWLHFKHNLQPYNLFNEIIQYALIIEWFDSVGIYVNVELDYLHLVWFPTINNNWNFEEHEFETRQEATKEAIKKANEIYNSK